MSDGGYFFFWWPTVRSAAAAAAAVTGGGGGVHGQRRAEKSMFSKERAPMSCSNVGHQPPATSEAPG